MARKWFSGGETGDFSECGGSSAGTNSVQTTTVRSGAYAFKFNSGSSSYRESKTGFALSTCYVRFYVYLPGTPSVQGAVWGWATSADSDIAYIEITTANKVAIRTVAGGDLGAGTAVLTTSAWNLIEAKIVISATVGVVETKVNGTTDQTKTGLNTGSSNVDRVFFGNYNGATFGVDVYLDDMAVDDAVYPGAGRVIARQWTSTAPTNNSWIKSTGSTIDTCWNDTPFSTATSANSGSTTSAIAQTAKVSTFASTQTGHGTDVIGSSDTINGVKVIMIAKTSATTNNGGLSAVRQITNAVTTDTNVTLTTSDAAYESTIYTTTVTLLNSSEGGVNKQASTAARTQTVEDAWMMVDYTPSTAVTASASMGTLAGISGVVVATVKATGIPAARMGFSATAIRTRLASIALAATARITASGAMTKPAAIALAVRSIALAASAAATDRASAAMAVVQARMTDVVSGFVLRPAATLAARLGITDNVSAATRKGAVSIGATPGLSDTARATERAAVSIGAVAAESTTPGSTFQRAASLAAQAAIAATAAVTSRASAALASVAALSDTARSTRLGSAAIACRAALAASVTATRRAASTLATTNTLAATARATRLGAAALAATARLTDTGRWAARAASTLAAQAGITDTARRTMRASAALGARAGESVAAGEAFARSVAFAVLAGIRAVASVITGSVIRARPSLRGKDAQASLRGLDQQSDMAGRLATDDLEGKVE